MLQHSTDHTHTVISCVLLLPYPVLAVNRSGAQRQRQMPITGMKHLPEIAPRQREGEGQPIQTESSHSADKQRALL